MTVRAAEGDDASQPVGCLSNHGTPTRRPHVGDNVREGARESSGRLGVTSPDCVPDAIGPTGKGFTGIALRLIRKSSKPTSGDRADRHAQQEGPSSPCHRKGTLPSRKGTVHVSEPGRLHLPSTPMTGTTCGRRGKRPPSRRPGVHCGLVCVGASAVRQRRDHR